MKIKGLIIFSILCCVFFVSKANAQIQTGDIILDISPQYPKANETVRASLSTFTTDLNKANISWILDGETKLAGIGKKNFSFTFTNSKYSKTLEAKIETISGATLNKKIILSSSNIDILWEAVDTYVPPFYKGKTLIPVEGNIKIVAIPNSKNSAGFAYAWKQDNKNKSSASGYEKNSYSYKNTYLEKDNTVEVSVSDLFGNNIGTNKITITPGIPKILFYEKDYVFGTNWNRSISNYFTVKEGGLSLIAEPYFFSQKNLSSAFLSFDWSLGGQKTPTPKQKNTISIKPEIGKSGNSTIKLVINNISTLFQTTEKELNVNF
jgi:hypothetical protein